jgi:subtilisin family serine protease
MTIDACYTVCQIAEKIKTYENNTPVLGWSEDWRPFGGRGITAGLLDTGIDMRVPDIIGANLTVRDFAVSEDCSAELMEHGTHSVTTLIGQGNRIIRGIAPKMDLLLAKVVGPDGIADPCAVLNAIDWVVSSGACIVIIPLGDSLEHKNISYRIKYHVDRGIAFFAAAGNNYPAPLLFPACLPYVIAVGAIDFKGKILPECNRLPRLDLLAPGFEIAAPISNNSVSLRGGSSVACVVAAGIAALALSSKAYLKEKISASDIINLVSNDPHKIF